VGAEVVLGAMENTTACRGTSTFVRNCDTRYSPLVSKTATHRSPSHLRYASAIPGGSSEMGMRGSLKDEACIRLTTADRKATGIQAACLTPTNLGPLAAT
jgi:hypothetical protein